MVDHSHMKLGRGHVKKDARTLKLGKYMKSELPPAPTAADWTRDIAAWGMMLNDVHADCTIAAASHAVQVWSAHTGREATLPDSVILRYYEQWDGYKANDPSTDGGGVELDVLNAWQKSSLEEHKLIAYADPDHTDLEEIRQAITLFGGVYIGLSLPNTAKTQAVWDVVPNAGDDAKPGSWGGHAVFVPKYDTESFTCITWGKLKPMTVAFWREYVDEAHALLSHDWHVHKGSPAGFNLAHLEADLALIKKAEKPAS